jgi:hypothetical protein
MAKRAPEHLILPHDPPKQSPVQVSRQLKLRSTQLAQRLEQASTP